MGKRKAESGRLYGWEEHCADMLQARVNVEAWQDQFPADSFPYLAIDRVCERCMYCCKGYWRFEGEALSGGPVHVGPLCQVLWLFHPRNPLWRMEQFSAAELKKEIERVGTVLADGKVERAESSTPRMTEPVIYFQRGLI